jgi:hypothetical protein
MLAVAETMFVTKYALSGGIQELEGEITMGSYFSVKPHGFYSIGRDAFRTRGEALADAEKRRVTKIGSLERQIAKLRKLKFNV